jgi:hypothetical protein
MGRTSKKKRARIPASEPKALRPEMRDFLDRCVIPTLVEKYLRKSKRRHDETAMRHLRKI